jgi:hypothetical protein
MQVSIILEQFLLCCIGAGHKQSGPHLSAFARCGAQAATWYGEAVKLTMQEFEPEIRYKVFYLKSVFSSIAEVAGCKLAVLLSLYKLFAAILGGSLSPSSSSDRAANGQFVLDAAPCMVPPPFPHSSISQTLRDIVAEPAGDALAGQLISGLVTQQMDVAASSKGEQNVVMMARVFAEVLSLGNRVRCRGLSHSVSAL